MSTPQVAGEASEPAGNCLMGNLGWMLDQANHAWAPRSRPRSPLSGSGSVASACSSAAIDAELTQTELPGMIGLDKTTMVVTVDELEGKGLAERLPSPTDRRARVIKVTDAGRARVAEGQQIIGRASRTPCWERCRRAIGARSWMRSRRW